MERATENKTGYELSIMEAEWQLHGSSLWKPFAFACGVFHNEKKKEYGNPLVKVLQVPYQFLGFFPGDITLYVFQWVYRKLYRLPWKGGHVCSAGFMSKRHGKNQTNQPLEVKLKKNQRMKEESQRWCWSSLYCRTIFLVPASKEYLANQYSWASGEALLHQTFWFYYYLCCLLSVWPWASYLTSLCLYFLTYKMEIQV